jgi:hypothetical protein
MIVLDRTAHTPWGTFGTLRLPDGTAFPTIERRWEYNAKGKSCIPAGTYEMRQRASAMVYRTSGNLFHQGWEITGVKDRSLIMIHPGNWSSDSNGCVLVGRAHAVVKGIPGVTSSRPAFEDLMRRLSTRDTWQITIRWTTPE